MERSYAGDLERLNRAWGCAFSAFAELAYPDVPAIQLRVVHLFGGDPDGGQVHAAEIVARELKTDVVPGRSVPEDPAVFPYGDELIRVLSDPKDAGHWCFGHNDKPYWSPVSNGGTSTCMFVPGGKY